MAKQDIYTFAQLLECLSFIHEQQQTVIGELTQENLHLQSRLHARSPAYTKRTTTEVTTEASLGVHHCESCDDEGGFVVQRGTTIASFAQAEKPSSVSLDLAATWHIAETANVQPPMLVEDDESVSGSIPDDCKDRALLDSQSPGQTPQTPEESRDMAMCIQPTQTEWPVPPPWQDWVQAEDEVLPRVVTKSTVPHPLLARKVVTRTGLMQIYVREDSTGQTMTIANRCSQSFIARPNSAARLVWDLLSSVMVSYDLVTIPLMVLTFDTKDLLSGGTSPFTAVMDWFTLVFWTIDIPWSFLTGYHHDGLVEMRMSLIAKHYLKRWFAFDFLVIFIDWVMVYSLASGRSAQMLGFVRIGKTARLARILRAVRLLRFVKLQRALSEALQLINSESIRASFNIVLAVLFIITINHYIACGWFLVGQMGRLSNENNWIEENAIEDQSVRYAYTTALHWSLSQFTPASMEIRPYNISERIYSIACLMFALITFSSFLGSITASITQIRNYTTEAGRQKHVLRAYFTNNRVSHQLSRNIWNFLVKNHFSHQTRSHKEKVGVLKLLPPSLMGKLNNELYGPYITRAPFFHHYMTVSSDGLMEICCKATAELSITCNEVLFTGGKAAERMFFIATGYLHYDHHLITCNTTIGTGAWVSEAVLWVKWVHIASMRAETFSEIISLDSAAFRACVASFKHSSSFVKAYAKQYYEYLVSLGSEFQTDLITDVAALETRTREAWLEVCSTKDIALFRELPSKEFPRLGKSARRKKKSRFCPFRLRHWHDPAHGTHPGSPGSGLFKH